MTSTLSADLATLKAEYDERGFLVVPSLFSLAEIAAVSQRTDEIAQHPESAAPGIKIGREGDTQKDKTAGALSPVRGIAFPVRFDPIFRELATAPKLLALARALVGPRIKLFRDQMLLAYLPALWLTRRLLRLT